MRHIKSYYGVKHAEGKLRCLLDDSEFTDLAGAEAAVGWNEAPAIDMMRLKEHK